LLTIWEGARREIERLIFARAGGQAFSAQESAYYMSLCERERELIRHVDDRPGTESGS
jgi:hypothetical protein